ncbi:MAG: hypothetical protein KDB07_01295, partial [Planctomycetes bacterium]|nr:hypothetical protein [Planctomycetota bacterium]
SFFGHAVSSQVEHLQAYRRFNARIATGFAVRQGFDFRFEFVGLWEERFNAEADPVEEAMRLGQWYNDLLEEMVREYPEQYLWAHRRFASRPAGAPSLYQDLGGPVAKSALNGQPQPPIPPRGR